MSSLEQKPLHFCPFCGESLTISAACRFCPYCGKRLKEKTAKTKKKVREEASIIENTEATSGQTPVIAETKSPPATSVATVETKSSPAAPAAIAKVKSVPVAPVTAAKVIAKASEPQKAATAVQPVADECTLVLKYCPDKEKLLRKLELLLRRDRFAIRLAVDMAPAVLMYKSKLEDVLPIADACREVGALTAVVIGPFSLQSNFSQNAIAHLSQTELEMVKKAPSALWAGEQISHFAGAVESGGTQGILALSECNLIFFAFPKNEFILRMLSLETLDTAQLVDRPEGMRLSLRQKQKSTDEVYEPTQPQAFLVLNKALQAILQRANYLK